MSKAYHYRVRNWANYNEALIHRGSLNLWLTDEVLNDWYHVTSSNVPGSSNTYSNTCIECALQIKAYFQLSLRATQGLLMSIMSLMGVNLDVPHYSTLSRRQATLDTTWFESEAYMDSIDIAIDSTGVKVYGEGEWKTRMHGYGYRRTWRKLHIAIDVDTQEIKAVAVSTNNFKDGELLDDLLEQIPDVIDHVLADGGYESFDNFERISDIGARAVIPPRKDAKIRQHGNSKQEPLTRDNVVREIRRVGRKKWKKQSGYHRRSLVETTMYRLKSIFGSGLSSRTFERQVTELFIKCSMLNKLTQLGMPDSFMEPI